MVQTHTLWDSPLSAEIHIFSLCMCFNLLQDRNRNSPVNLRQGKISSNASTLSVFSSFSKGIIDVPNGKSTHLFQFFTCNFTLKYLISRFYYLAFCEFWKYLCLVSLVFWQYWQLLMLLQISEGEIIWAKLEAEVNISRKTHRNAQYVYLCNV